MGKCAARPILITRALAGAAIEPPLPAERQARRQREGKKRPVVEYDGATRQVIAFRIPDHVIDEDDWGLVHALLPFLHERVGGLIQADGEGFYDADGKLLVALK